METKMRKTSVERHFADSTDFFVIFGRCPWKLARKREKKQKKSQKN